MGNDLVTFFDPELSGISYHVVLGFLPLLVLDLNPHNGTPVTSDAVTNRADLCLETKELTELSLCVLFLEAHPSITNVSEASPHLASGTSLSIGSLLSEEPLESETELEDSKIDFHFKKHSRSLLIEDFIYLLDDVVCEHVLDIESLPLLDHAYVIANPLHLLPLLLDEGPLMDPNDVHLALLSFHIRFPVLSHLNPFLEFVSLPIVIEGLEVGRALLDVLPDEVEVRFPRFVLFYKHLGVGVELLLWFLNWTLAVIGCLYTTWGADG